MEVALSKYIRDFTKLRRDYSNGGAPHKPILLLAVCNLVSRGTISSARIEISSDLVLEFKDLWSELVHTPHVPTFSLPFFHLKTAPFWRLIPLFYPFPQSISSLGVLRRFVLAAEIDLELFTLLTNPIANEVLRNALINAYFPGARMKSVSTYGSAQEIQNQILNEDHQEYELRIQALEKTLTANQYEEEVFVRGGIFKKVIPRIYNFQCAISEMRVETTSNAQMIDACHIIPFSQSKDDTITNGISLCPNLHRAFDRGLIRIDADYKVRISSTVAENDTPYSLRQFEGKRIALPDDEKHIPAIANLIGHGERWRHMFG